MIRKLQIILNSTLIFIALILYNYATIRIYGALMKICYLLIVATNLIAIYSEIKTTYPRIKIISILLKSFVVLIIVLLIVE